MTFKAPNIYRLSFYKKSLLILALDYELLEGNLAHILNSVIIYFEEGILYFPKQVQWVVYPTAIPCSLLTGAAVDFEGGGWTSPQLPEGGL